MKRILVLGETIDDVNYVVKQRSSLEEPRPTYGSWELLEKQILPGGARNVYDQIVYLSMCLNHESSVYHLDPFEFGIMHTQKIRYFTENHEKLLKVNSYGSGAIGSHNSNIIVSRIEHELDYCDVVIAVDMEGRFFNDDVIETLVKSNKSLFVDVQRTYRSIDYSKWKHATVFMNFHEMYNSSGQNDGTTVFKNGEHGFQVVDRNGKLTAFEDGIDIKSLGYKVVDTTGAGDALLAAYVVFNDTARANRWAAYNVTKPFTQRPDWNEFLEFERKINEASSR